MFDTMVEAETRRRLRELRHERAQARDPEDAWSAGWAAVRWSGPAVGLPGVRRALRAVAVAVANLF